MTALCPGLVGARLRGAGGGVIRAERRAGELLREMEKAPGAKGIGKGPSKVLSSGNDSTHKIASVPTLKALGITRDQSSDWQKRLDSWAPALSPGAPIGQGRVPLAGWAVVDA